MAPLNRHFCNDTVNWPVDAYSFTTSRQFTGQTQCTDHKQPHGWPWWWSWVECGQGSNLSQSEYGWSVHKEQDCARSWCALSVDVLVSVLNVQCSATQAVKCCVASSSPSSLASVSLSFRSHLYNFTFPHCRPDSPCCDTVSVHPTLYP